MGTEQGVSAQDPSPEPPLARTARDLRWLQGLGLEEAGVPQGHLRMEDSIWDQISGSVGGGCLWGPTGARRTPPRWAEPGGSRREAGPLGVAGRGVLVTYQYSSTWAQNFVSSEF